MVQPYVREDKIEVSILDHTFIGGLRLLSLIHLVVCAGLQYAVLKQYLWAADQGFIASAYSIVVHNRDMNHVKLIFNTA